MMQQPNRPSRPTRPDSTHRQGWSEWASDHRGWIGLAGATAALTAAAVANHLSARGAEADTPPVGKFVTADGVRLHYFDRGAGPAVMLLHGNGVSLEDYRASGVMDALADTHRVIAFDRPGFGYSDRPRVTVWTPAAQAKLIVAAMRGIGVHEAIVVGHSWGTMVALAMALDHPASVRGLVLLSGYYYPTVRADVPPVAIAAAPGIGDLIAHTTGPLTGKLAKPALIRASFAPAAVNPAFGDQAMALSLRPSQLRATVADTALMIPAAHALSRRYADLTVPTVVMAGAGDLIAHPDAHAERLVREIAGSTLRILPDQGHLFHYAMPGVVAEAVAGLERDGAAPAA